MALNRTPPGARCFHSLCYIICLFHWSKGETCVNLDDRRLSKIVSIERRRFWKLDMFWKAGDRRWTSGGLALLTKGMRSCVRMCCTRLILLRFYCCSLTRDMQICFGERRVGGDSLECKCCKLQNCFPFDGILLNSPGQFAMLSRNFLHFWWSICK